MPGPNNPEWTAMIGNSDQFAPRFRLVAGHPRRHLMQSATAVTHSAVREGVEVSAATPHAKRGAKPFRQIISGDTVGGVLLIAATAAALMFSNTSLAGLYGSFLDTRINVTIGEFAIDKPLLLWINDGMMAVFFLLVGLELKREFLEGELSDRKRAALPAIAAFGGVLVPSLIYAAINADNPEALRGWAIPAATDIAFAMGILAMLGSRVPTALKVFLLAVAIIDDLAAIVIIAMFYTADLSFTDLAISAAGVCALAVLNRQRVTRLTPYILIGAVVWAFLLKSGVHATLAGVVTALFVPHIRRRGRSETVLESTEHDLKPWVMLGIMPLFAFANAGVALVNLSLDDLLGTISLGIAAGLTFGKPIGILCFVWLAVRTGVARLPAGVDWPLLQGASLLAGIGFTMSLFIGTLAFSGVEQAANVRVGVLCGSFAAGLAGFLLLRYRLQAGSRDEAGLDGKLRPATGGG